VRKREFFFFTMKIAELIVFSPDPKIPIEVTVGAMAELVK
jgi:hypothetical protein